MADIEENVRRKAAAKKEVALSPIAIEVVRRIDALFEIEPTIDCKSAEERLVVRQTLSRPLTEDIHAYMREQLAKLSGLVWASGRERQDSKSRSMAFCRLSAGKRRTAVGGGTIVGTLYAYDEDRLIDACARARRVL
jgi:hypothetical protein